MRQGTRGHYTLEFKQEAVRPVESGQTMAAAARSLGVVEQTLGNRIELAVSMRKHLQDTFRSKAAN